MDKWKCIQCFKQFNRYKSQIRNKKRTFCSLKCRGEWQKTNLSGNLNPNYKNGLYSSLSLCPCGKEKDYRADKCSLCSKRSFPVGKSNQIVTEDLLRRTVKENYSYLQVANKLGITRTSVVKYIINYGISTTHFHPGRNRPIPNDKLFTNNSEFIRNSIIKDRLIKESLIQYICQCGQGNSWNKKELVLQLDHINGDRMDNRLENLRFLCPNCHSQTSTYCGKNVKRYVY